MIQRQWCHTVSCRPCSPPRCACCRTACTGARSVCGWSCAAALTTVSTTTFTIFYRIFTKYILLQKNILFTLYSKIEFKIHNFIHQNSHLFQVLLSHSCTRLYCKMLQKSTLILDEFLCLGNCGTFDKIW